jgi:two-component system, chemotaxis family, protein-glutamate methylesterase/glutaminase
MAHPSLSSDRAIRVLVVDDSPFMRRAIERLIAGIPGAQVAGTAGDGLEAVKRALELRPDVITMDVEMPRMNGVSAVAEIMATLPTPIVMLSTLTTEGADTTLRALEAGAVEIVAKPSGLSNDLVNVGEKLAEAVTRASHARVVRRHAIMAPPPPPRPAATGGPVMTAQHIVVIGSSTGGPPALTAVVPKLPASLPAGVVVVQHMPPGFTGALAKRLDSLSQMSVREAKDGDLVAVGQVLVAPGDFHLIVGPDRRVRLDKGPSLHGVRPSVDITLQSVAAVYGKRASVAILTGMGRDGADGCTAVEGAGGAIFTQDEPTCVVYGMPRVAKERTRHAIEAPLDRIADLLSRSVPGWRGAR